MTDITIYPMPYANLNRIAENAWDVAEESGWHRGLMHLIHGSLMPEQPTVVDRLMDYGRERVMTNLALIHSEVSEAVEAVRKDPTHIGEELADVLIRTLELAHMLGIDIGEETRTKMIRNRERADVPARGGVKAL